MTSPPTLLLPPGLFCDARWRRCRKARPRLLTSPLAHDRLAGPLGTRVMAMAERIGHAAICRR